MYVAALTTFVVRSASAAIVRSEMEGYNVRTICCSARLLGLCRRILYSAEDIFFVQALQPVSPWKSPCRYKRRIFVLMEEISSSLECPKSLPSAQHGQKLRLVCNSVKSRNYGFRSQGAAFLRRSARTSASLNLVVGLGGLARSQGKALTALERGQLRRAGHLWIYS